MNMKQEIAILGHFGGNQTHNDGQTVKTKTLCEALERYHFKVHRIDTFYLKRNPLRFLFSFITSIIHCSKIIILLSDKGRRFFFPIMHGLGILGKSIYHDSIGGQLAKEAAESKRFRKYLSAFRSNWVESEKLKNALTDLGVSNAEFVPNFKHITPIIPSDKDEHTSKTIPFRFCTFSRVMKEKGISDAIHAIATINARHHSNVANLSIYGPIEENYRDEFCALLKSHADYVAYKGIVEAEKSIAVLSNYFMLLFPTFWKGEGMPGTIIDALGAALPIIARRWDYCDEILEDGKNAWVYDFDQPQQLVDKIDYAISHPSEVMEMKNACLHAALRYSEGHVMKQILQLLEQE